LACALTATKQHIVIARRPVLNAAFILVIPVLPLHTCGKYRNLDIEIPVFLANM